MNQLDERSLRELMHAATADVAYSPDLLERIRCLGRRRLRIRRTIAGAAAAASLAGIGVTLAGLGAAPASGRDQVAVQPNEVLAMSHASVAAYAAAHGGTLPAGPFSGRTGTYAAYAVGLRVATLRPAGRSWQADGPSVSVPGGTTPLRSISAGPAAGPDSPTVLVQWTGGDVTTEGVILVRLSQRWSAAHFAACSEGICEPGSIVYDARVTAGALMSTIRACKPDCATGHQYVVTWRWSPRDRMFVDFRQRLAG